MSLIYWLILNPLPWGLVSLIFENVKVLWVLSWKYSFFKLESILNSKLKIRTISSTYFFYQILSVFNFKMLNTVLGPFLMIKWVKKSTYDLTIFSILRPTYPNHPFNQIVYNDIALCRCLVFHMLKCDTFPLTNWSYQ